MTLIGNAMLHINRFVWTRWTQCRWFQARSLCQLKLKSYCSKTACDLWWRHMTWNACYRGRCSDLCNMHSIDIFYIGKQYRLNLQSWDTKTHLWMSVLNECSDKQGQMGFLSLTLRRLQNWPTRRSRLHKIRDKHFVGIITLFNHWEFQIDPSTSIAGRSFKFFEAWVKPIPGGLWKARKWAEGPFNPPPRQISKTTNRSDKRQTAFDSSLKDLQLLHFFFFLVRSILSSPEVITNNMAHKDLDR